MTALPPDGWKRVPPGELDRLEGRLRWRRWFRNLTRAAIVAVLLGAGGFGAVQAVDIVIQWTSPTVQPAPLRHPGGDCTAK
jgi:hypothetical protein